LALHVPLLTDGVVRLRPWRDSDVPAMLQAFGDPWFQQFSDWAPRTPAQAHAYLVRREQGRRDGREIDLAVVAADADTVLGGASLNDLHPTHLRAAVGYWLAPGARGRGAATRAVRLLAGWAFGDLGLARLELSCGPDNRASQRVAERCGFSREGVLRSHLAFKGGRRDTVLFSLLPGELASGVRQSNR
jgi:RimJ/RimL family protein N-acetyltransferase